MGIRVSGILNRPCGEEFLATTFQKMSEVGENTELCIIFSTKNTKTHPQKTQRENKSIIQIEIVP